MDTYIDYYSLLESLGYLGVAFVLFIVGKIVFNLSNRKTNVGAELVEKDNFAFSIAYVGYFSGLIIILIAVLGGNTYGFLEDVRLIIIYGLLGILALVVSQHITKLFILNTFSVHKEIIVDQNAGTGVIVCAMYMSNAFLVYGALIGEASSLLIGITTFAIYWLIGNVLLVLSSKIFTAWMRYDIHKEIEKDNVAAGIAFAGALLAISIVIMNSLSDPFLTWQASVVDITLFTIIGITLLPIIRFITDKVLLRGRSLTDEIVNQQKPNVGAGLIEAFAYIATAALITWTF